ncbi:hypothetical protein T4A_3963 [Trichinella pseudospiralis]|uniref:EB domain-containing protein n=1 Tax=Trichinella pseudospiralis TaxID=6337 RepID=A0A0V1K4J8_TRIPS|nr:hypothetical protein T4A_3963 [Trichinella pseudospiralis]KRZ42038.1 hypothetical protein T4C_8546 [Trichinella pseudospiralis]
MIIMQTLCSSSSSSNSRSSMLALTVAILSITTIHHVHTDAGPIYGSDISAALTVDLDAATANFNKQTFIATTPKPLYSMPSLGMPCRDNSSCDGLLNSYCADDSTCQCLPYFLPDPVMPYMCSMAPIYGELCQKDKSSCKPFVCNSTGFCDCPDGYEPDYFTCIKSCKFGMIAINDQCYEKKQINDQCEIAGQCVNAYSQCLHGKCQCIPGVEERNGNCYPVAQCPIGQPAKDKFGRMIECETDDIGQCPEGHHCLLMGETHGFCCPRTKVNCPVGQALMDRNCTNCPWETHYCFIYTIGNKEESMCCPSACPISAPLSIDGKCYTRSAFSSSCEHDKQCFSTIDAVCREDADGEKKCLCPEGNYINYFESKLGDSCQVNEECKLGTNTLCINGTCQCYVGYMPVPVGAGETPTRCIGEPFCPTKDGPKAMKKYVECNENDANCAEGEYCRKWWMEAHRNYSTCCSKPTIGDYEAICEHLNMRLSYRDAQKTKPLQCTMQFFQSSILITKHRLRSECPTGAHCLFNPYSINTVNAGICCKEKVQRSSKLLPQQPLEIVDDVKTDFPSWYLESPVQAA